MTVMKTKSNRMGGAPLVALFVGVCLMGLSAVASTCIVSTPVGDRDPHHSLSSAVVAVDAGSGTCTVLQSWLEARFRSLDESPGIAISTMPLALSISIR